MIKTLNNVKTEKKINQVCYKWWWLYVKKVLPILSFYNLHTGREFCFVFAYKYYLNWGQSTAAENQQWLTLKDRLGPINST